MKMKLKMLFLYRVKSSSDNGKREVIIHVIFGQY